MKNQLFPVFIKLQQFNVLVVGGGKIALEKINAIFNNSPQTRLLVIAKAFAAETLNFIQKNNIHYEEKEFEWNDLDHIDVLIVAINDKQKSAKIKAFAQERRILANVADTPELCDFYLSSVVQKGNVKVAISTNGLSPTLAKRLKELLNESLPDEIDELSQNLNALRNRLKGDFADKVKALNEHTKILLAEKQ